MSKRAYKGDPLDMAWRPGPWARDDEDESDDEDEAEDESVIYVTEPEAAGEETTVNVPIPGEKDDPVKIPGQSTLAEYGDSGE